jgi:hypothetical protein
MLRELVDCKKIIKQASIFQNGLCNVNCLSNSVLLRQITGDIAEANEMAKRSRFGF